MTGNEPENLLDRFSVWLGHAVSWLTLFMVLGTVVIVVLRYVFDTGVIWLQESIVWMHAAVFMLGAAYTLQRDEHVRVDVFYREMSRDRQALINMLGVILFLWPLCAFFAYEAWDYVSASWKIGETSRNSGGLPFPAVPLMKTMLLLLPLTLALQGLSMLLKSARILRGGRA